MRTEPLPEPTERLLLRAFGPADADALFALHADPRAARYLSRPAWTTLAQAQARIAQDTADLAEGIHRRYAIERTSDARLLGECTLFGFNAQCRRAEIGYALAPEAWGRGYMHEALRSLVAFGFSVLGLNRIEADIDPRNLASARSLERLGFVHEGLLRERWIVAGEVSDSGLYGLLLNDWRSAGRS